jgi:hypothetical protein
MTLQQQILPNAAVSDRSSVFRLKALFSEQRAQESTDPNQNRIGKNWRSSGT